MWSGNFKTSIASLRESRWRTFFTMMGIIIGISSVVTVVSLGEGLKQQILGQINQLGSDVVSVRSGKLVNKSENGNISGVNLLAFLSASNLTESDVNALSKLPSVNSVVPIEFVTSSANTDSAKSDNLFIIGTTPDMADVLHQKVQYGEFFESDGAGQNFAVIGSSVARILF